VHKIARAQSAADALKQLSVNAVDLIIIDPELEADDGYAFVRDLRNSSSENRFKPIIITSGHARISKVWGGRDCGANFFVAKPITPAVLLERIYWVAADHRKIVEEQGGYVGPDRRFKFEGPPLGSDGRRSADLPAEVGEQVGGNLSETELSGMFKPQKILI
jgi:DNA-binding response OmpR family regulator